MVEDQASEPSGVSQAASSPASAIKGTRVRSGRKGVPRVRPATAVHVPRQRGGARKAQVHEESAAVAVQEPETQQPEQDVGEEQVAVREAKRPDPVPLPPPPQLPSIEGLTFLDVQAPAQADAEAAEEAVAPRIVPLSARPVSSDEDESSDASHTKMLLVLFLCTLIGGAAAIGYFISTQEVNPLEGLF